MTSEEIRQRRRDLENRICVFEQIIKEMKNELKALRKECPHKNWSDQDFIDGPGCKTYSVCTDCEATKPSWQENFSV